MSKRTRQANARRRSEEKNLRVLLSGPVTITRFNHSASKRDKLHATADAFLLSFEWRRVRMQALKKYGARCQCCGASPAEGAVMNVDHVKPRKLFPHLALDMDNLQILCHECNHGKGNWDHTDWREEEVDAEVLTMLRAMAKED